LGRLAAAVSESPPPPSAAPVGNGVPRGGRRSVLDGSPMHTRTGPANPQSKQGDPGPGLLDPWATSWASLCALGLAMAGQAGAPRVPRPRDALVLLGWMLTQAPVPLGHSDMGGGTKGGSDSTLAQDLPWMTDLGAPSRCRHAHLMCSPA
jgi:hypothetical protein